MDQSTHDIPSEAIRLVERGEIIEAIKVTREQAGLSLNEAKAAIDVYRRNPQGFPQSVKTTEKAGPVELPRLAINALEKGQLLAAIKRTREANGLGLREAKDTVTRFLNQDRATRAKFTSASSEHTKRVIGSFLIIVSLLGLIFIGYEYFFGSNR